jgi:hypothetical protein
LLYLASPSCRSKTSHTISRFQRFHQSGQLPDPTPCCRERFERRNSGCADHRRHRPKLVGRLGYCPVARRFRFCWLHFAAQPGSWTFKRPTLKRNKSSKPATTSVAHPIIIIPLPHQPTSHLPAVSTRCSFVTWTPAAPSPHTHTAPAALRPANPSLIPAKQFNCNLLPASNPKAPPLESYLLPHRRQIATANTTTTLSILAQYREQTRANRTTAQYAFRNLLRLLAIHGDRHTGKFSPPSTAQIPYLPMARRNARASPSQALSCENNVYVHQR